MDSSSSYSHVDPYSHRPGSIQSPFQGAGGPSDRPLGGGPPLHHRSPQSDHSGPGFLSQWEANQARAYQSHLTGPANQAHLSYAPLDGYTTAYPPTEWDNSTGDLSTSTSRHLANPNSTSSHHSIISNTPTSSIYNTGYMPHALPPQPGSSSAVSFVPAVQVQDELNSNQLRPISTSATTTHSSIYASYQGPLSSGLNTYSHEPRYNQPDGSGVRAQLDLAPPSSSGDSTSGPQGTEEGSDEVTVSSGVTDGGTMIKRERKKRRLKGEIPRDHESLGKYQCDECQARFARPSALATHTLTHTKEKPFACTTCQRSFAVMSNLRRHCRVRKHTTTTTIQDGRPVDKPAPLDT